jgi:hypothetical protein
MNRSSFPKIFLLPVFMAFIIAILPACHHESLVIEDLDTVCFYGQVMPILQTCGITGCHDGSEEGFLPASYQSIMLSVAPGDPRGSKLYQVITDIYSEEMMPPDRPLTEYQRSLIQVWITQGALETTCDTGDGSIVIPSDSICFVQHILPIFISNCAMSNCHDGLSQGEEEDLFALNSYSTIRQHVIPFNPSASHAYEAITGEGEEFMPPSPNKPLTTSQIESIRQWIVDGALNSDCPELACDTNGTISFAAGVKPIIDNNCVSCHNSSVTKGGINLDGYVPVKSCAETMRNGTSLLTGVIRHKAGFSAMPPGSSLDECSIRKVELWISQGRLNN